MWQRFGILVGGYAFIVLSYAWVWSISAGLSRHVSGERMDRPVKADVKAVLGMMAVWTVAWAAMLVMGCRM